MTTRIDGNFFTGDLPTGAECLTDLAIEMDATGRPLAEYTVYILLANGEMVEFDPDYVMQPGDLLAMWPVEGGSDQFTRPLWSDYASIKDDLPALLEIARLALHHDTCEFFILENQTGLNQDELMRLRSRLDQFVSAESPAGSTGSPLARAIALVGNDYNPHMNVVPARHMLPGPEKVAAVASAAYDDAQNFAYLHGEVDFHAAGLAAERAVLEPG